MNTGDIANDHFGRVRRLLAMSIEDCLLSS